MGRPVSILVPPGRDDGVPGILARIRNSEPVKHLETVRRRKDGFLLDISLSLSSIRPRTGVRSPSR